ncbi:MAG TPA: Calx-beta domain-containing protein [Gemmataceae bacterium]|nr:Calx-beta domain-containing protein [Gemmataceae bacterium]
MRELRSAATKAPRRLRLESLESRTAPAVLTWVEHSQSGQTSVSVNFTDSVSEYEDADDDNFGGLDEKSIASVVETASVRASVYWDKPTADEWSDSAFAAVDIDPLSSGYDILSYSASGRAGSDTFTTYRIDPSPGEAGDAPGLLRLTVNATGHADGGVAETRLTHAGQTRTLKSDDGTSRHEFWEFPAAIGQVFTISQSADAGLATTDHTADHHRESYTYYTGLQFTSEPTSGVREVRATHDDHGTSTDKNFGTYLAGVKLENTFTVRTEGTAVKKVRLAVAGLDKVWTLPVGPGGATTFEKVNVGRLPKGEHDLTVTALNAAGQPVGEPFEGKVHVVDALDFSLTAGADAKSRAPVTNLRLIDGIPVALDFQATVPHLPLADYYKGKLAVGFFPQGGGNAVVRDVTLSMTPSGMTGTFPLNAEKFKDVPAANADDDYDVHLVPRKKFDSSKGEARLGAGGSLFVTPLPDWMGDPVSTGFEAAPADVFGGAADAYAIRLNLADAFTLHLPETSGTPFGGLFDGLDSSARLNLDLTVYARLTDEGAASVKFRATDASVSARLLGAEVVSAGTALGGDLFTVIGEVADEHTLTGLDSLTLKLRDNYDLLGGAKPRIEKAFGPWPVPLPPYGALLPTLELGGRFSAQVDELKLRRAQVQLRFGAGGPAIDKANSYFVLAAKAQGAAALTAGAGVEFGVPGIGSFTLAQVNGELGATVHLTSELWVNFDHKSATLASASRAQLDVGYLAKYSFNALNLIKSPPAGYQVAGKLATVPLFGMPGPAQVTDLSSPANYEKNREGFLVGDDVPSGPAPRPTRDPGAVVSTLDLKRLFYDDLGRLRVTAVGLAATDAPTAGAHRLDVLLVDPAGGETVLHTRDLAAEAFAAADNPLGYATAPLALDLAVPPGTLDPLTPYILRFRLTNTAEAAAETVHVRLADLTADQAHGALGLTAVGADLADGLDIGPETGGHAQAVIRLTNTGTGPLRLDQPLLVGRGFELVNAPAAVFALAPGDTFDLGVRVLNAAKAAQATLRFTSDDPAGATREVPLRYALGAVAQQVSFLAPDAAGYESIPGKVKVVLARPAQGTVTVDYAVTGGTAAPGTDFQPFGGTLTFRPGQTVQYVRVPTVDNPAHQGLRTIEVTLSNPQGAALGAVPAVTYAVRDDDPLVTFGAATAEATEGAKRTTVRLPVYLSGPAPAAVTVRYRVTGGSATAGKDYVLASGKLTFAPSQTRKEILLSVLPDTLTEGDETLVLTLSDPTGGLLGAETELTVTLKNRTV